MNNTNALLDYIDNHQPEVIFFDIGKVLVDIDFQKQNKITLEDLQLNKQGYKEFVEDYFHDFLAGTLSSAEFDQLFKEEFGRNASLTEKWREAFKASYTPNTQLLGYLDKLAETTTLSIISNIFPEFLEVLQDAHLLERFNQPVYSCEVGFAKPDQQIFHHALTRFPEYRADQCLFVDDKNKHIESARQVGLLTYRYTKFNDPNTNDFTNV